MAGEQRPLSYRRPHLRPHGGGGRGLAGTDAGTITVAFREDGYVFFHCMTGKSLTTYDQIQILFIHLSISLFVTGSLFCIFMM